MAEGNIYALISKRGHLIVVNGQLPLYWRKSVAREKRGKFQGVTIVPIKTIDLHNLIQKSYEQRKARNKRK